MIIKKILSFMLCLCFILTSILPNTAYSQISPKLRQNLSPQLQVLHEEFKERYYAQRATLSHEAINQFLKDYFQRTTKANITINPVEQNIGGNKYKVYFIDDLLAQTGQLAHVGISSNNIYIDKRFDTKDRGEFINIIKHEDDVIQKWNSLFIYLDSTNTINRRAWLKKHITEADPALEATPYALKNSLQLAKDFHDSAHNIKFLYDKYLDTNLDFTYIDSLIYQFGWQANRIFQNEDNPSDIIISASSQLLVELTWLEKNTPELIGKTIATLSMEGNIPELVLRDEQGNETDTSARDANTKGGLGAYQGDKYEGLAQTGLHGIGFQPLYEYIRNGDHLDIVNYLQYIDAGILEPILIGENALQIWTGIEHSRINSNTKGVIIEGRNVQVPVEVYRINRAGTYVYLFKSIVLDELYTTNRADRFIQESVFGKAVFEFMKNQNIAPDILHLNEAHTVVAAAHVRADQIRQAKSGNQSIFDNTAIVYTNHTLVDAGLEKFPENETNMKLRRMTYLIGLPEETIEALNNSFIRIAPNGDLIVDYCKAAYLLADIINAVSDEHAIATVDLFKKVLGKIATKPIIGILNGSGSTWKNPELLELEKNNTIPNQDQLWQIHQRAKKIALDEVEKRTGIALDPNKPTMWAIRRLVEYKAQYPMLRFIVFVLCAKRETTFTRDQLMKLWYKHLPEMTDNPYGERETAKALLEILFAGGKTEIHGLDMQIVVGAPLPEYVGSWAQQFKSWVNLEILNNNFVYISGSDATLLRMQAIGSCLLLELPEPLLEACGTSGQRTALNGGVTISIDGAGPAELITDYDPTTDTGNGFLLETYTKNNGTERDLERFYTEGPAHLYEKLTIATNLFYKNQSSLKKLMLESYIAANYGSNGKKAVTAEAMEKRYTQIYSAAIKDQSSPAQAASEDFIKTKQINTILADEKQDLYYTIRYNQERFKNITTFELPGNGSLKISIKDIIEQYIALLEFKGVNPHHIKLLPTKGKTPVFSVKSYKTASRRNQYGEGIVNIQGDISSQPLRSIGLLNMAFAASNIRINTLYENMNDYEKNMLEIIVSQCKAITRLETIETKNILEFIQNLPEAQAISLNIIEHYNRLALKLLVSA